MERLRLRGIRRRGRQRRACTHDRDLRRSAHSADFGEGWWRRPGRLAGPGGHGQRLTRWRALATFGSAEACRGLDFARLYFAWRKPTRLPAGFSTTKAESRFISKARIVRSTH